MSRSKVRNIQNVATNLSVTKTDNISLPLKRAAFLCLNTYVGTRFNIGDDPIISGYYIAKCLMKRGYEVFYMVDPTSPAFLLKLDFFLKNTEKDLVCYYSGFGVNVWDEIEHESETEPSEGMYFSDKLIPSSVFAEHLANKRRNLRLVLLSDCCFNGDPWKIVHNKIGDVNVPSGIICLNAHYDRDGEDCENQGQFTYKLGKLVKEDNSICAYDVKKQMKMYLKQYAQVCKLSATTKGLIKKPLF